MRVSRARPLRAQAVAEDAAGGAAVGAEVRRPRMAVVSLALANVIVGMVQLLRNAPMSRPGLNKAGNPPVPVPPRDQVPR